VEGSLKTENNVNRLRLAALNDYQPPRGEMGDYLEVDVGRQEQLVFVREETEVFYTPRDERLTQFELDKRALTAGPAGLLRRDNSGAALRSILTVASTRHMGQEGHGDTLSHLRMQAE